MTAQRIAVIGSGTAGSSSAILLEGNGHQVTLFEKIDDPKPVGAGIMMQPSGMGVLHALGLAEEIYGAGARVDRLDAKTGDGRVVLDLRYAQLNPDYFGVGLHRGALFNSLYGAVLKCSITVHTGVEIVDITQSDDGACSVIADDGTAYSGFDLVIVAAGARTSLRRAVGIPHTAREYPWGALWFVAEDQSDDFSGSLTQHLEGAHTMLGLLPTGLGPYGQIPLTSIFWSIRADRVDAWKAAGLAAWKDHVRRLEPRAEPLLEQISDVDDLLFAPYFDIVLKRPYQGRVIFLGDAAHATSPQLGQGCNLALVDAWVLADCLSAAETVPDALRAYARQRTHQIAYYQWATRFLTPFFQSDSRFLPWLRDRFMGFTCRVPTTARLMTSTMCGLRRGIFRSSMPVLPLALPPPDPSAED